MIKRWSVFNESSNDLRKTLSDNLSKVREVLLEFEDMEIIDYSISPIGYNGKISMSPFNPNGENIERYLDRLTPVIQYYITRGSKEACIEANLKLPSYSTRDGNSILLNEDITILEDILTASKRLLDLNYTVELDFNSNHHKYKPLSFLIFFDLSDVIEV